ncbi:MAG: hypothetical protein NT150_00040 [Bacteroidetes bacterium]|nr:hypothetical protein [Bacteroidota bacterium]
MKKTTLVFLIVFSAFFGIETYAHGDEVKETKDTSMAKMEMPTTHLMCEDKMQMQTMDSFPNYHPLIAHFPIVLLIVAALLQLIGLFVFKKEMSWIVMGILLAGVITTFLATNVFHAHAKDLSEKVNEMFELHEKMAYLTLWTSLLALVAKIASHFFLLGKRWAEIVVTLLLFTSAITVSITGHHGAKLVYIEGVGPQGKCVEMHENHH